MITDFLRNRQLASRYFYGWPPCGAKAGVQAVVAELRLGVEGRPSPVLQERPLSGDRSTGSAIPVGFAEHTLVDIVASAHLYNRETAL